MSEVNLSLTSRILPYGAIRIEETDSTVAALAKRVSRFVTNMAIAITALAETPIALIRDLADACIRSKEDSSPLMGRVSSTKNAGVKALGQAFGIIERLIVEDEQVLVEEQVSTLPVQLSEETVSPENMEETPVANTAVWSKKKIGAAAGAALTASVLLTVAYMNRARIAELFVSVTKQPEPDYNLLGDMDFLADYVSAGNSHYISMATPTATILGLSLLTTKCAYDL